MEFIFYIAASISLAASIMTVTRRNAVHALLYLVVSLLAVAVIFFMIGVPFVAALEVIIYAGAIMVLFIFVMMMLNLGKSAEQRERRLTEPSVFIGPVILSALLAACFVYLLSQGGHRAEGNFIIGPAQVGISMFTTYLLGTELAGMLILAGLVGAYHLGRKSDDSVTGTEETRHSREVRVKDW
jgi:NADH-quinone oxidoreductase subunit J